MIKQDALNKKCPKCFGLGKILNPSRKNLNMIENIALEKLDESIFYVCKECNGTGIILPDEVKELLEYILS